MKIVATEKAPKALGPYSQGYVHNGVCLLYTSYDKFIHTNMGISAIAAWLNQHGYKKKKRQNNTLDAFAASFIKGVLDLSLIHILQIYKISGYCWLKIMS